MNPWAIIPLVSFLAFGTLAILVLPQSRRPAGKIFVVLLVAAGAWSFTSFMLDYNLSASTQTLIFWNGMVITTIPWAIVSYYHFVRAYTNKPAGIGVYI